MKKHIRNILVALMTLSLLMLAGCGGGSSETVEAPDASEAGVFILLHISMAA